MSRVLEIEDVADIPVFYINWQNLSVVKEVLSPYGSCDWLWYSRQNDCFLTESELYFSEDAAFSALKGYLSNL